VKPHFYYNNSLKIFPGRFLAVSLCILEIIGLEICKGKIEEEETVLLL
jgi:hypothetical protein